MPSVFSGVLLFGLVKRTVFASSDLAPSNDST